MNKKNLATIILSFITVGILIFITVDLWSSINSFKTSQDLKRANNVTKIKVVTSFYPLYFFSQQIAGDKADILNITPIGVSPHNYQPTTQELAKIENSNLIILNGLGLEPWSDSVQSMAERKGLAFIFASGNLSENQVIESEKDKSDPHIWLSPVMAKQMVDKILDGFVKVDAKNSDYYKTNANKLKLELDRLDLEYKNGLANCENKNIVVLHSAFSYLAKDYDLNQLLLSGVSVNEELSEQQMKNITDLATDQNIKYFFVESLASSEWQKNVEEKTGVKILSLNNMEISTTQDQTNGENYFLKMRRNLMNLETGLDCGNNLKR